MTTYSSLNACLLRFNRLASKEHIFSHSTDGNSLDEPTKSKELVARQRADVLVKRDRKLYGIAYSIYHTTETVLG